MKKSLLLLIFFVLFPLISSAAEPLSVVINEIAWMGDKVEGAMLNKFCKEVKGGKFSHQRLFN